MEDFGITVSYFTGLSWLNDLYCLDNYEIAEVIYYIFI